MEAIQNYQSVEQQYRTKYKQRLERQFKIGAFINVIACAVLDSQYVVVKPDASPEEVKAVVNDDQGGQIFSQAVSVLPTAHV